MQPGPKPKGYKIGISKDTKKKGDLKGTKGENIKNKKLPQRENNK